MPPQIDPRKLTVGQLRKAIEGLDDATPVVIDNESHEYRPCGQAVATTAVIDGDDRWREDLYSSDGYYAMGDCEYGFRLKVLRIDDM